MANILPGAEPFFFRGGPTGVLLIHGFTGAPREVLPLGQVLAAAGCTVLGVRLTHHGTQPADMFRSAWRDWSNAALDGYHLLRQQCPTLLAMGLSMGGALALHLAAQVPLAGVVTLSTPSRPLLNAIGWRGQVAGPLSYLRPFVSKGPADADADPNHVAYSHYPVRAIGQLWALLATVEQELPRVSAPALLVHSRGDTGVAAENMPYLFERLGSPHKEMLWLEHSGHIVTEGVERDTVFARVLAFVRAHAAAPPEPGETRAAQSSPAPLPAG